MLTDNLVRLVALDGLGAWIPVRNMALRVEHVDGIIVDTLDEHSKALLAFEQRSLLLLLCGDVAGNLGETDVMPVRVVDRVENRIHVKSAAVLPDAPALCLEATLCQGG